MSTRLSPEQYLACIDGDSERLALVAERGLDPPVPPCPGWTVGEAVRHTASVYWHKVMCMRLGRQPEASEWPRDPADGQGLVDWFRESHQVLRTELTSRHPEDPALTWWPPEQNVAFWYRRMAHEVAIHRADVESGHDVVTPIDEALAVDGIDELLRIFATDPDAKADGATGQRIAIESGAHRWVVVLGPDLFTVAEDDAPVAATVRGSASDLDLSLWNRPMVGATSVEGDATAVSVLHAWLAAATQ